MLPNAVANNGPKIGERIHKLVLPMGVLDADFSEKPETVFAACMDGVYRANLADKNFERLDEHQSYVSGVRYVAEKNELISTGYDGAVQWYSLAESKRTRQQQLHAFWSWKMSATQDRKYIASVTGQYLAGGIKYEPAPATEPTVVVVDASSGEVRFSAKMRPSVQAVCFSPNGKLLAAANLMGDIEIWDWESGKSLAAWNTPDFTSWGIIKSHCYIGGIHAIEFSANGKELLVAGMGPMHDPMAGNGAQRWQRFEWEASPIRKIDETRKEDAGEGLMETLAITPDGSLFVMAGRLRGGNWNVGLFSAADGKLVHSIKTGFRVTAARFDPSGKQLLVCGLTGQPGKDGEKFPHFGQLEVYRLES